MTTRLALVGANFGATLASGFADLENAELVALADPAEATRTHAANALGIASDACHASLDDLLFDANDLDALIVASPTHLHERHVGAAFDRGLHVLCAAPIGVRGSEASHIVTSAGLVGKTFMYANPLCYDPRIAIAQGLVEAGEIGEPLYGQACIQIPDWPHPPESWRLERDLGGGALLEIGAQTLDALWFCMDAPDPMEALATRYDLFSSKHANDLEHPAEDTLCGQVRFKNGATLQITAQLKAPVPEPRQSLSLVGTRGSLDIAAGLLTDADGQTREYAKASCQSSQLRALAVSFLQAVQTGQEPAPGGKKALALHKMTDALLSSARERQAVAIKVERSLDDLFGAL